MCDRLRLDSVALAFHFRWLIAVCFLIGHAGTADSQPPTQTGQGPTAGTSSWLVLPVVSSNPKLGTSGGALGAYLPQFDPASRVSLIGVMYQYTSTHSSIAAAFARTSFGADHHRIVAFVAAGLIKNDYEDYLGTGQALKTNDDLHAFAGRYLYRLYGDWFIGGQGAVANYQVLGESPEDDAALEVLGVRGFESAGVGAVALHDSRDSEDMPEHGWYFNINNFSYREKLGGSASYDAFRADTRVFWRHGGRHVLAVRQNNWLTNDAPIAGQGSVVLRGYKIGEYLAPYMSSLEFEERLYLARRWRASFFAGAAGLYGPRGSRSDDRHTYPAWGTGIQFVIKPAQRMLANFEYAQGIESNRGLYLKFGYAW